MAEAQGLDHPRLDELLATLPAKEFELARRRWNAGWSSTIKTVGSI
jgi:hypothetical protein